MAECDRVEKEHTVKLTATIGETDHKFTVGDTYVGRLGENRLRLRPTHYGLLRFVEDDAVIKQRAAELLKKACEGTVNNVSVSGDLLTGGEDSKTRALIIEAATDATIMDYLLDLLNIYEGFTESDKWTKYRDETLLPGCQKPPGLSYREGCIGYDNYRKSFWKEGINELVERTPEELTELVDHPQHLVTGKSTEYGVSGFNKIMTRAIPTKIVNAYVGHGFTVENLIREDESDDDSPTVKKFRHSLRLQAHVRFKDQDANDITSGKISREELLKRFTTEKLKYQIERRRHHSIVEERDAQKSIRLSVANAAMKDLKEGKVAYGNLGESTQRMLSKQRKVDNKQKRIEMLRPTQQRRRRRNSSRTTQHRRKDSKRRLEWNRGI